MRRNAIGITMVLALMAGATGVAAAQGGTRPERPRTAQDSTFRRGPGGGGGPDAMLLRGITLSRDQQERVAALRAGERQRMAAGRERGVRGGADAAAGSSRGMRQRGDTAGMAERRARMEKLQTERIAALRSILTADQQAQFDRNVADLKARRAERGAGRGGAGAGDARGARRSGVDRPRARDDARPPFGATESR